MFRKALFSAPLFLRLPEPLLLFALKVLDQALEVGTVQLFQAVDVVLGTLEHIGRIFFGTGSPS